MFSPENFYPVIKENYILPNQSLMFIPRTNGEKNLMKFSPLFEDQSEHYVWQTQTIGKRAQSRIVFMYDQEPLSSVATNIYKCLRLDITEIWAHEFFKNATTGWLAGHLARTIDIPIWCHSEFNSSDIQDFQDNLFIPCYYWYHAFISRDWFRHWQFNKTLQPKDKSQANQKFLLYARSTDGTRHYRKTIVSQLKRYKNYIRYDWNHKENIGPEYSSKIEPKDADCAVHLVAETLFDVNKVYLTEKVFKPMVMSQPFIVWGPPKTLSILRSYGFLTFSDVWNEDYDNELNHDKRMAMLINLVDDLIKMPQKDFHSMYQKCLKIIDHNRQRFFSQSFMEQCYAELNENFQKAFYLRNVMIQQYPGGQFCHLLNKDPRMAALSSSKSMLAQCLHSVDDDLKHKILRTYPDFTSLL